MLSAAQTFDFDYMRDNFKDPTVAGMTDVFVLLQLPNAGDELQALKKGVLELADLILVNKTDLDEAASVRAEAQIASTLHMLRREQGSRAPLVMRISAATGTGIDKFLDHVTAAHAAQRTSGELDAPSAALPTRMSSLP